MGLLTYYVGRPKERKKNSTVTVVMLFNTVVCIEPFW